VKVYIGRYPSDRTLRRNPDAKQKKSIRIDKQDTWNMAETLAEIILPMLKQLKAAKHGSPGTMPAFNEDTNHQWPQMCFEFYKEGDTDAWKRAHDQWDEAMDKMIWSFEQIVIEDRDSQFHSGHSNWTLQPSASGVGSTMVPGPGHTAEFHRKAYTAYYEKIQEGLDLFGKYYMNLWD
jgi:hypothetical protein